MIIARANTGIGALVEELSKATLLVGVGLQAPAQQRAA